jgi:hypothetical protein
LIPPRNIPVHQCSDLTKIEDASSWQYLYTFAKPGAMPSIHFSGKYMEYCNGTFYHPKNYSELMDNKATSGTIWKFSIGD